MHKTYDCLALFSGGLDSLLACKLIQSQGLKVLGLHFVSPFFGNQLKIEHWQNLYSIDLLPVDISQEFTDLLLQGPPHGLGKWLNPCVDCKILMLNKTRQMLSQFQAKFIISGEVLGQRPMSQRKDMLHLINKKAGTKDILLRPLSAQNLPPTTMELTGQVDRSLLLALQGRGRKTQLNLARKLRLPEIPTPAGGCLLTEPETVKRIWPVLQNVPHPDPVDFELCKVGRQYWADTHWLIIGRSREDNQKLLELIQPRDILFKLMDLPGPIAVGRQLHGPWSAHTVKSAALFILGFSSKARQNLGPVRVRVGAPGDSVQELSLLPDQNTQDITWKEASWKDFEAAKASGPLPLWS